MDLILEYTLSAAAVAKGFTAYAAALCGFPLAAVRLTAGPLALDPLALLAVLALRCAAAARLRRG
jgi:APA family basic amino acid/polyamine antiporter